MDKRHLTLPAPLTHQRRILGSTSHRRLFVAGVGSGKTFALAMAVVRGIAAHPGEDGAIFAPSFRMLERVVLPTIRSVIPSELYTYHPHAQCLRFVNGSVVWLMGVDRQPAQRIIGMNLAWAVFDEAGASTDGQIVRLINQRLRRGNPARRFLALFTSPHGHGWLSDWSEDGVDLVNASTYDNPHLSREYIAELERDFPPGTHEHEQELLGRFVSLTGRVYGHVFSRAAHSHPFAGDRTPYVLTVDPGYRASAWLAWQRPAIHPRPWVVVREWLPSEETTEASARRILADMGARPERVLMDVPSRQNSRIHVNDYEALVDTFGRGCHVRILGGHERSSDWRHKSVLSGIGSGALKVSERLCPARITHGERGLVHSLETLEWPHPSSRVERQDEQDPRKHVIDALEFGAAVLTPPRLARSEDRHRLAAA
jgi:hypothetical protein